MGEKFAENVTGPRGNLEFLRLVGHLPTRYKEGLLEVTVGFLTLGVTPAVWLSPVIQVEEGAAGHRLPVTGEPRPAVKISTHVRPFPFGRPLVFSMLFMPVIKGW